MKPKAPAPEQVEELQRIEEELSLNPTVEGCLDLADRYSDLRMAKDAQRLIQVAELLEKDASQSGAPVSREHLLSGSITPLMLIEVLQILTRTRRSGDLMLQSTDQTFHIFFDQGEIVNAHSTAEMPGLASFLTAMRISEGTYRFVENNDPQVEHLIEHNTDQLIMEVIRQMDENSGGTPAPA